MLSERDSSVVADLAKGVKDGIEALTPAAKHVYELAIRQVFVEGFAWLMVIFVLLPLGWFVLIPWTNKVAKESDSFDAELARQAATAAVVVATVVAACSVPALLTMLLNPEWAAIRNIAGVVAR